AYRDYRHGAAEHGSTCRRQDPQPHCRNDPRRRGDLQSIRVFARAPGRVGSLGPLRRKPRAAGGCHRNDASRGKDETRLHGGSGGREMNFDDERLRQAMEAGKILPNAADIAALDRSLHVIQQRHRVRLTEKERDHTALIERARKIRDAAATILSAVETDRPDPMGEIEMAFELFELSMPRHLEPVRALRNRAEQLLLLEEREFSIQSKRSRIKISTE